MMRCGRSIESIAKRIAGTMSDLKTRMHQERVKSTVFRVRKESHFRVRTRHPTAIDNATHWPHMRIKRDRKPGEFTSSQLAPPFNVK